MKVKLCGFKDQQSVMAAIAGEANFIGFVFCEKSPRYVDPDLVADIAKIIPPQIAKVAVLANIDLTVIKKIYKNLSPDYFQFHGSETPGFLRKIREIFPKVKIIKAFQISSKNDLKQVPRFNKESDMFLFDNAAGGSGESFDWTILEDLKTRKNWFLSGGLNVDNISDAVRATGAQMIDVSSGIEKVRGEKSAQLIEKLMAESRNCT